MWMGKAAGTYISRITLRPYCPTYTLSEIHFFIMVVFTD